MAKPTGNQEKAGEIILVRKIEGISKISFHLFVYFKSSAKQGFGIAITGGVDNPNHSTGDPAVIVSDIVKGSPADGTLRCVFLLYADLSTLPNRHLKTLIFLQKHSSVPVKYFYIFY